MPRQYGSVIPLRVKSRIYEMQSNENVIHLWDEVMSSLHEPQARSDTKHLMIKAWHELMLLCETCDRNELFSNYLTVDQAAGFVTALLQDPVEKALFKQIENPPQDANSNAEFQKLRRELNQLGQSLDVNRLRFAKKLVILGLNYLSNEVGKTAEGPIPTWITEHFFETMNRVASITEKPIAKNDDSKRQQ